MSKHSGVCLFVLFAGHAGSRKTPPRNSLNPAGMWTVLFQLKKLAKLHIKDGHHGTSVI